jgi:hypothetical protein
MKRKRRVLTRGVLETVVIQNTVKERIDKRDSWREFWGVF